MNPRDAEFKALANSFYDSLNIPRAKPKLVHINLVGERSRFFCRVKRYEKILMKLAFAISYLGKALRRTR